MQAEHPWGRVLGEMAVAARHDPRAEVADEAAKMLFETAQRYASTWDEAAWQAVHSYSFSYLLELPFPSGHLPDASGMPRVVRAAVRSLQHNPAYIIVYKVDNVVYFIKRFESGNVCSHWHDLCVRCFLAAQLSTPISSE